jgi:hypothetical protein
MQAVHADPAPDCLRLFLSANDVVASVDDVVVLIHDVVLQEGVIGQSPAALSFGRGPLSSGTRRFSEDKARCPSRRRRVPVDTDTGSSDQRRFRQERRRFTREQRRLPEEPAWSTRERGPRPDQTEAFPDARQGCVDEFVVVLVLLTPLTAKSRFCGHDFCGLHDDFSAEPSGGLAERLDRCRLRDDRGTPQTHCARSESVPGARCPLRSCT